MQILHEKLEKEAEEATRVLPFLGGRREFLRHNPAHNPVAIALAATMTDYAPEDYSVIGHTRAKFAIANESRVPA
jgi:hypothetical protein